MSIPHICMVCVDIHKCMCIYVYNNVYMHTCYNLEYLQYMYLSIYLSTYLPIYLFTYLSLYMYIYIYGNIYIYTYIGIICSSIQPSNLSICQSTYRTNRKNSVCIYIYMCIYVCIYIYIHIYTHNPHKYIHMYVYIYGP